MKILFSLIGFVLGAAAADFEGAACGFALGFLFGGYIQHSDRIRHLEEALKAAAKPAPRVAPVVPPPPVSPAVPQPRTETRETAPPQVPAAELEAAPAISVAESAVSPPKRVFAPLPPPEPDIFSRALDFIRTFFTTGNVVVKVGVIILFFGAAFLIRYAVERNALPIEFRLAGIAAGGVAMLITGWRLRQRHAGYGLVLQGGAVGILYLTVFATVKPYALAPAGLAFPLMVALVVFSGFLAIAQNSRSLATLGAAGGFLAPVLLSTGSGSHVTLFSYYAILNAGILGISWFKAWRVLNWVGFMFTFVIGLSWGCRYYQPTYFASTEPFLILFFVFYVAITILFTHRQPPRLASLVDGTLVFGVPLIAFTLQAQMVKNMEFGEAYSALVLSAFYLVLARLLWQRQVAGMRLLTESFLAIGVVFVSLAVPYALDGRWTAATWSLEGAGIVWVGLRQQRLLARWFGLLLQFGAALAFMGTLNRPVGGMVILNSAFVGMILIAVAALFTSYCQYRSREALPHWERDVHVALLGWGVIWWLAAGFREIDHFVADSFAVRADIAFAALSFLVLDFIARRVDWPVARLPGAALLPMLASFAVYLCIDERNANPFAHLGFVAWPVALGGHYLLLHRVGEAWPPVLVRAWHAGSLWLTLVIAAWSCARFVDGLPGLGSAWTELVVGVVPALAIAVILREGRWLRWPVQAYRETYLRTAAFPVIVYCALWVCVTAFSAGGPAPLPYLPVLNPLEVSQLLVLVILIGWIHGCRAGRLPEVPPLTPEFLLRVTSAIAFLWLNAVIARTVHFWKGVPFTASGLFHSDLFQTGLSIVWIVTALVITGIAARTGRRAMWFTGATLIAAVVVKLFFIDLNQIGTIARIVSFLTVGVLLLVIGYLAPLPPRFAKE